VRPDRRVLPIPGHLRVGCRRLRRRQAVQRRGQWHDQRRGAGIDHYPGGDEDNATSVTIDYQPTNPLPVLTDKPAAGTPSIKILSPQPGATVCDLFGKPGVAGYGHWHLNLDSTSGPMMGMGSMVGMSCQAVMHATAQGLKSGETHTLIALLADDSHAPLNPPVEDKVEVKIG
jgi:hypothetical protein